MAKINNLAFWAIGLLISVSVAQVAYAADSIRLASGSKVNWQDFSSSLNQAQQENKLIFVDLSATWCPVCRDMEKNVLHNSKVGEFLASKYVCAKVDYDSPLGKQMAQRYKINGVPGLLVFEPNGQLRGKQTGGPRTADDFISIVSNLSEKTEGGPLTPAFQTQPGFARSGFPANQAPMQTGWPFQSGAQGGQQQPPVFSPQMSQPAWPPQTNTWTQNPNMPQQAQWPAQTPQQNQWTPQASPFQGQSPYPGQFPPGYQAQPGWAQPQYSGQPSWAPQNQQFPTQPNGALPASAPQYPAPQYPSQPSTWPTQYPQPTQR